MTNRASAVTCVLALAALAGMTAAAAVPEEARQAVPVQVAYTAAAGEAQLETLDEVVIEGRRLFARIVALEDRFYRLYNDLNTRDEFDVHCSLSALFSQENSRIEQRACLTEFYIDAMAQSAAWERRCEDDSPCYQPPMPELVLLARRAEFERNVLEVVNSDPRLKAMVQERAALEHEGRSVQERYLALRAERHAGGPTHRTQTRRGL